MASTAFPVRIVLPGDIRIESGEEHTSLPQRESLRYLATRLFFSAGQPLPRKQLAFTLWHDDDPADALANLCRHIHLIRFTTSSGVPGAASGNPFPSGLTEAVHGVLRPAGYYLVSDWIGNRVGVYRINNSGASTTLTAVSGCRSHPAIVNEHYGAQPGAARSCSPQTAFRAISPRMRSTRRLAS